MRPFLVVLAVVGASACASNGEDGPATGTTAGQGGGAAAGTGGSAAAAGTTGGKGGNGGTGGSAGSTASGGGGGKGGSGGSGGAASGASGSGGTGGSGGSGGSGNAGEGGGGGVEPGACGSIPTFADGIQPLREIFVDAAASGSGDGSAAAPYDSLDAAFADVGPGTAVRIRAGTYPGGAFASGLAGTAEAPIWIGGEPGGARPVISGGSVAFQLSGASYVVVHDLEISGQADNGLNIDDGEDYGSTHHLLFQGLSIHDIGSGGNQDCLKLSGIDDYFVLDNEFRGCSGGSAIDHVGCHRGIVARNLFAELGGNGVQSKGGSQDIEITQNRFVNAGERAVNMGGSTGFEFFRPGLSVSGVNVEARDIRVIANVFSGGISPIAFVGCVDCLAAANTIVNPEHWVVRILQETTSTAEYAFLPASDGRFIDNIIYYSRADLSTTVNIGPDTAPETFEFSNNLWYAVDSPGESEPTDLPVSEADGVYGEDPAFADAAGGDFHIDAQSPAAGAGLADPEIVGDVEGRCYAAPPSIGAHEVP